MAHAQSRSAEPMTSLTKEDGKTFGTGPQGRGESQSSRRQNFSSEQGQVRTAKRQVHTKMCARRQLVKSCCENAVPGVSPLSLLTPSTSYASSTPRVNWNTTRNSCPHFNRRLIFGKAKRAGISCSTPSACAIHGHPRGHIRLRPRVRAKQVRHYLQGRRNCADPLIRHSACRTGAGSSSNPRTTKEGT